jgi:putative transposase
MVVSGLPHHVTQRGNRREPIFFEDGDLLGEQARKADVEVWAYCLMPNHVHLILNPRQADGLGRAVGEAHRRYTNFINARGRWTGHLFQSRFASVAMDESHLISAVCCVSLRICPYPGMASATIGSTLFSASQSQCLPFASSH